MSVKVTRERVLEVLRTLKDPHTGMDVVNGGFVQGLEVRGTEVQFMMRPPEGEDTCPQYVPLTVEVKRAVMAIPGVTKVDATLVCHLQANAVNRALRMLDKDLEGR